VLAKDGFYVFCNTPKDFNRERLDRLKSNKEVSRIVPTTKQDANEVRYMK
jgi:hypothetical protein